MQLVEFDALRADIDEREIEMKIRGEVLVAPRGHYALIKINYRNDCQIRAYFSDGSGDNDYDYQCYRFLPTGEKVIKNMIIREIFNCRNLFNDNRIFENNLAAIIKFCLCVGFSSVGDFHD